MVVELGRFELNNIAIYQQISEREVRKALLFYSLFDCQCQMVTLLVPLQEGVGVHLPSSVQKISSVVFPLGKLKPS